MKTCTGCGKSKPLTDFTRDKTKRDGLGTRCKDCKREWRLASHQRILQTQLAWREANRQYQRDYASQRRLTDPEAIRKISRRSRLADRARELERQRAWREVSRDYLREKARQYAAANHEQVLARQRVWREANPDHRRAYGERYRAAHRKAVLDHYGRQCVCCGCTDDLQIDHVHGDGAQHRIEIGGSGSPTYRWLVENGFPAGFQTLCRPCNDSKKDGELCRLDHGGNQ